MNCHEAMNGRPARLFGRSDLSGSAGGSISVLMASSNEPELRIHYRRAIQSLPKSTLRDLASNGETRERAIELAVDILVARLEELARPADLAPD